MCGAASKIRAAATGAFLAAQPRRELDARPRQGQGQQGDRSRAEQQQQQVSQPQPPLVGVVPFLDEPQGREFQQLRPSGA